MNTTVIKPLSFVRVS